MKSLNFTQLQLLLQNDELHYISDSTQFFIDNQIKSKQFKSNTFILFENTINDYNETISLLNSNNIKYTIKTDSLNLDYILI